MEVICLESTAFYELVERVVTRVLATIPKEEEQWVSPEKAMSMLNISSKTTLQKFRDQGKVRYSQPAKKIILYDRYSIYAYLDSKAKDAF